METSNIIITCILSSTVAAALVNALKEFILWKWNRKATKEDNKDLEEDKIEEIRKSVSCMNDQIDSIKDICTTLEKSLDATSKANKIILQDRIKTLVFSYIQKGEISYEDKKLVHEMWNIYHYGLGGNGDLDDIMDMLDQLPLKVM